MSFSRPFRHDLPARLSRWAARSLWAMGLAGGLLAAPAQAQSDCLAGRCEVSLKGSTWLRDGKPWVPKGVVITGFLAPEPYLKGVYAKARRLWGPDLLRNLKSVGVDTLRFNLGLAGVDPTNPMADGRLTPAMKKQYLQEVADAVALAKANGMVVIITLTDGEPTGFSGSESTPGRETVRAWTALAPMFANDPAVILNAFNEPGFGGEARIDEDPSPWQAWRTGYQMAVDAIRATGARNVIMLNGISTSRVWRRNTDANVPRDPLGKLAYDIHPFPTDSDQLTRGGKRRISYVNAKDIDHWLDGWCDRHACLVSAFYIGIGNDGRKNCYDDRSGAGANAPQMTREFLDYFQRRQIGVMIFAGDWSHRLFENPAARQPRLTSFEGFKDCKGDPSMGPGEMLRDLWTRAR